MCAGVEDQFRPLSRGTDRLSSTRSETQAYKRAGGTQVLWEADATVRRNLPASYAADGVIDEAGKFLLLLFGNGGPEVPDFDQALADEDNLGTSGIPVIQE